MASEFHDDSDADVTSVQGFTADVELALNIPFDVVQDDQVVALVQVISPDADLSDILENWDIYNIDLAERSDYPEEDLLGYNSEAQDEEYYSNPDSENDVDQDSYQEPDDNDYDPDPGTHTQSWMMTKSTIWTLRSRIFRAIHPCSISLESSFSLVVGSPTGYQ